MKILIVDDEILVRKGIAMSIPWDTLGFSHVFEAANGIDALEIAIKEVPDLIITDIRMPKMDGIQLIEELRKRQIASKVICLSCLTDSEHIRKAMRFDGALDYIPKLSVTNDELIEIVKKTVAHGQTKPANTDLLLTSPPLLSFHERFTFKIKLEQQNLAALKPEVNTLFETYSTMVLKDCIFPEIIMIYSQIFSELGQNIYHIKMNHKDIPTYLDSSAPEILEEAFYAVLETVFREYTHLLTQQYGKEIVNAIRYMYLNYQNVISLGELSQLLAMNPSYFSKYFKKKTGINYVTFLNNIRIEKAKEYLKYTDYSIVQIALEVGFANETYFSRLFKNIEHLSPAAYREKQKNNSTSQADISTKA